MSEADDITLTPGCKLVVSEAIANALSIPGAAPSVRQMIEGLPVFMDRNLKGMNWVLLNRDGSPIMSYTDGKHVKHSQPKTATMIGSLQGLARGIVKP